jgi:predicted metal-dependent hydrolase
VAGPDDDSARSHPVSFVTFARTRKGLGFGRRRTTPVCAAGASVYNVGMAETRLRSLLLAAAREFNSGRYFEAHEAIEEGLDDVPDELWELCIGLIQIAVGYHKTTQGLWSGAAKMLGLGLQKVEPFAADAGGIHLEALRRRVREDIARLAAGRYDAKAAARNPPRLQPLA